MRRSIAVGVAFALGLSANGVFAQTLEKLQSGEISWQAGVEGVSLDFNPDGTIKRIYSKYSHAVTIPDKRGIQTARIIAEEKAKGSVVRFLQQTVASGRVVNEFENTLSNTKQEKTAGREAVSSTDQRTIAQSLNELTSSFSSGTLTGVVVLESGYDEKDREVWVVVGLSQKTMAAAKATQNMLNNARPGNTTTPTADQVGNPGSQIRRGNQDF